MFVGPYRGNEIVTTPSGNQYVPFFEVCAPWLNIGLQWIYGGNQTSGVIPPTTYYIHQNLVAFENYSPSS